MPARSRSSALSSPALNVTGGGRRLPSNPTPAPPPSASAPPAGTSRASQTSAWAPTMQPSWSRTSPAGSWTGSGRRRPATTCGSWSGPTCAAEHGFTWLVRLFLPFCEWWGRGCPCLHWGSAFGVWGAWGPAWSPSWPLLLNRPCCVPVGARVLGEIGWAELQRGVGECLGQHKAALRALCCSAAASASALDITSCAAPVGY